MTGGRSIRPFVNCKGKRKSANKSSGQVRPQSRENTHPSPERRGGKGFAALLRLGFAPAVPCPLTRAGIELGFFYTGTRCGNLFFGGIWSLLLISSLASLMALCTLVPGRCHLSSTSLLPLRAGSESRESPSQPAPLLSPPTTPCFFRSHLVQRHLHFPDLPTDFPAAST